MLREVFSETRTRNAITKTSAKIYGQFFFNSTPIFYLVLEIFLPLFYRKHHQREIRRTRCNHTLCSRRRIHFDNLFRLIRNNNRCLFCQFSKSPIPCRKKISAFSKTKVEWRDDNHFWKVRHEFVLHNLFRECPHHQVSRQFFLLFSVGLKELYSHLNWSIRE